MRLLDGRLDLDTRCNYRCIYCQSYMKDHGNQPWFPLETLDTALKSLSKHCWIVYLSCGGEPLMHPQFCDTMPIVKKRLKNCDVNLVTNGFLLSEEKRSAILEACVSRVQISIHSLDSKKYAHLYGSTETAKEKVCQNIASLVEERKNKKWPRIIVTTIAMKSTLHEIPDIARWIVANNIDGMNIQWLIPFDTPGMNGEALIVDDSVIKIFNKTEQILKAAGKSLEWPSTFKSKKLRSILLGLQYSKRKLEYLNFSIRKFLASRKTDCCHIAGNYLWLTNTGEIKVCHKNAFPINNLFNHTDNESIGQIYSVRQKIQFNSEPCTVCPYLLHSKQSKTAL